MSRTQQSDETVESSRTLPADGDRRERRPGLRAAGVAVSRLAGPIIARQGGGALARLKSGWNAAVGAETAESTWPDSLTRGGVLKLRVVSAQALELQHRAPLLIQRINGFFGRPVVTRLVLVQGPLPLASPARDPGPGPLGAAESAAIEHQVAAVDDPELRAALARLGRAVWAASRRGS
jgi:hypothetical protein